MDKAKTIQKWLCKKLTVFTVYSIYSLDIIRRAQKQELKCWSDFIFLKEEVKSSIYVDFWIFQK